MKYRLALVAVAGALAVLPLPQHAVEQRYSRGWYPALQSVLTSFSNLVPVALLDLLVVGVLSIALAVLVRRIRTRGVRPALMRAGIGAVTTAATVYLLFLVTWGLNYRRVPLEQKVAFHAERLTSDAARQLAALAVEQVNKGYPAARQTPLNTGALEYAFIDGQQLLGTPRFAEPGRPKRSLLQFYFRWTAISGMTVPGFLEVIVNPDLLPVEIPFTLTHEWAHLAGYADESEANFFAWLACIRSPDPLIRYSGWLETYGLALQGVPRSDWSSLPKLDEGPRQDLRAINARLARSSPRARAASRSVYDSYLKANRVEEGIRSYDAALRLMLGTTFGENWHPVLR